MAGEAQQAASRAGVDAYDRWSRCGASVNLQARTWRARAASAPRGRARAALAAACVRVRALPDAPQRRRLRGTARRWPGRKRPLGATPCKCEPLRPARSRSRPRARAQHAAASATPAFVRQACTLARLHARTPRTPRTVPRSEARAHLGVALVLVTADMRLGVGHGERAASAPPSLSCCVRLLPSHFSHILINHFARPPARHCPGRPPAAASRAAPVLYSTTAPASGRRAPLAPGERRSASPSRPAVQAGGRALRVVSPTDDR